MDLPDRLLRTNPDGADRVDRVAFAVERAEGEAAAHEIRRWRDLYIAKTDLRVRAEATEVAIEADLTVFDRGMEQAGDDPVKQELILRYVQDLNAGNRATIRKAFD